MVKKNIYVSTLHKNIMLVSFQLQDVDTYIHRAGRTGRAGRSGISVVFHKPDQQGQLRAVERRAVSKPL